MVAQNPGGSASTPAAKKGGMPTWLIVLLVVVGGGFVLLLLLAPFAIYGVKKYVTNAKRGEAREVVHLLARSVAGCATALDESGKPRGLPESTQAVPADPARVAGKKYQTTSSEWSAPAFACSGFVLTYPQYFQYQYRRLDTTRGEVIAVADLDGDGTPDSRASMSIECSADGSGCRLGPMTTEGD